MSLGATDSKSTTQTKKPRQAYEKRERSRVRNVINHYINIQCSYNVYQIVQEMLSSPPPQLQAVETDCVAEESEGETSVHMDAACQTAAYQSDTSVQSQLYTDAEVQATPSMKSVRIQTKPLSFSIG